MSDDEIARAMAGEKIEPTPIVCHTWITNGQVIFLGDCSHDLAGQTLDLLDIE